MILQLPHLHLAQSFKCPLSLMLPHPSWTRIQGRVHAPYLIS